jgi:hypothetical protein
MYVKSFAETLGSALTAALALGLVVAEVVDGCGGDTACVGGAGKLPRLLRWGTGGCGGCVAGGGAI